MAVPGVQREHAERLGRAELQRRHGIRVAIALTSDAFFLIIFFRFVRIGYLTAKEREVRFKNRVLTELQTEREKAKNSARSKQTDLAASQHEVVFTFTRAQNSCRRSQTTAQLRSEHCWRGGGDTKGERAASVQRVSVLILGLSLLLRVCA